MDKKVLILFLLSIILILADHFTLLAPLKEKGQAIIIPFKEQTNKTYTFFKKRIQEEDKGVNPIVLQKKIEHLTQENALLKLDLQVLQRQNEEARRLLQAPLPPQWRFLPAKVLGEKEGILQIGIGTKSQAEIGDVVVVGEEGKQKGGILVGKITKADPLISLVQTPRGIEARIPAKAVVSNERGEVVFLPDKGLVFSKVLQKATLQKEQMVVTSGEDGFPPDLLIGTIERVEKNEVEVYQKAILVPLIDYQTLETVFLVKQ